MAWDKASSGIDPNDDFAELAQTNTRQCQSLDSPVRSHSSWESQMPSTARPMVTKPLSWMFDLGCLEKHALPNQRHDPRIPSTVI